MREGQPEMSAVEVSDQDDLHVPTTGVEKNMPKEGGGTRSDRSDETSAIGEWRGQIGSLAPGVQRKVPNAGGGTIPDTENQWKSQSDTEET